MALPASDAFTAANNTLLTTYSTNWTLNNGSGTTKNFKIFSNALYPDNSNNEVAARWNVDTFNNDQYALGTITAVTNGHYMGVSVRCSTTSQTWTFYDYIGDSTDGSYVGKYAAGVYTQLGSKGAVFTSSLAIRLNVSGSTITPIRAGATADIGAQSDSSIASGSAGVAGYGTNSGTRLDDWQGGNITVAKAMPVFSKHTAYFWRKKA